VTGASLPAWVEALAGDASLDAPGRLHERVAALERLERSFDPADVEADGHLRALRERLERANEALYEGIRDAVRQGRGGEALHPWIARASRDAAVHGGPTGEGYDALDELVAGVLRFDAPAGTAALPPEMVAYQPTPARHAFDMIERLGLREGDVLFDLGAGLGHVPLLAAIRTRARCVGIELDPALVECARRGARALGLGNVEFRAQDACEADLSEGTVFYLYTPFIGSVLHAVLEALRRQAARRAIRICTFGPCTQVVAQAPWLRTEGPLRRDRVAIFHPR
jgi:hypothetical protein